MAMNSRQADGEQSIVVAPQQRPPQVKQYLAMLTSLDPVIGSKSDWDVDQLLELAQSRTGAVSLGVDSDLHFEGLR
jgi:hypothetical protein